MSMETHFKEQIDAGATTFFYAVEKRAETLEDSKIEIKSYKDALENFPTDLEFVEMMLESMIPLFRPTK